MNRLDSLLPSLPPLSAPARTLLGALYERQPQTPALLQAATGLDDFAVRCGLADLHGAGLLKGGRRLTTGEPGYVWLDLAAGLTAQSPGTGMRRTVVQAPCPERRLSSDPTTTVNGSLAFQASPPAVSPTPSPTSSSHPTPQPMEVSA